MVQAVSLGQGFLPWESDADEGLDHDVAPEMTDAAGWSGEEHPQVGLEHAKCQRLPHFRIAELRRPAGAPETALRSKSCTTGVCATGGPRGALGRGSCSASAMSRDAMSFLGSRRTLVMVGDDYCRPAEPPVWL